LATRAMQSWGAGVVILGSPAERSDADRLQQQISGLVPRGKVRNLTGASTLKQLAALLRKVDAAVSNDSGPMHLAAGLGTPTLGVFTCTSAVLSGPPGDSHELVSTTVDCAASYRKTCPHHGARKHCCQSELDVERVWRGLERLVERNSLVPLRSARVA
jgi:heptosyltransferase I